LSAFTESSGRATVWRSLLRNPSVMIGAAILLCVLFIGLAAPFLQSGQVVEILADFAPPPLGIYAVLPSNRYIPHRVAVLMDFLAKALAAMGH